MKKIGVVGLGNMGHGMALSLQRAGFDVSGHDPSEGAALHAAAQGIRIAPSVRALAESNEALILSLPTSAIVESVVFGAEGLLAAIRPDLLVIDTTTADPDSTRRVGKALNEHGMRFIDAPVSGGPKGAISATMTMVLGGASEDIALATPILEAMSARRVHVGPVGAGHVTKLLNNLLCGAQLLLAGEAARIARQAGLEPERIFQGINAGSGRSAVTEINYPSWIFNDTFDSGFTMKLMRKDMGLALSLLHDLDVAAPLSCEAGRLWGESVDQLGDAEDFNRIVDFIDPRR